MPKQRLLVTRNKQIWFNLIEFRLFSTQIQNYNVLSVVLRVVLLAGNAIYPYAQIMAATDGLGRNCNEFI